MLLLRSAARPTAGLRSAALLLKTPSASPAALASLITRPHHPAHTPFSACSSSSFSTSPLVSSSSADASPDTTTTTSSSSSSSSSSADIYANNPILQPPWRLSNLRKYEREAWEKHGPAMLDHLEHGFRHQSLQRVIVRAKQAQRYETELGPNWYAIVTETGDMVKQLRLADGRTVQEAREARRREWASITHDLAAQDGRVHPDDWGKLSEEIGKVSGGMRRVTGEIKMVSEDLRKARKEKKLSDEIGKVSLEIMKVTGEIRKVTGEIRTLGEESRTVCAHRKHKMWELRKQKYQERRWPFDHEVYNRCLEEVKRKYGVSTGPASEAASTSPSEPLSTPW